MDCLRFNPLSQRCAGTSRPACVVPAAIGRGASARRPRSIPAPSPHCPSPCAAPRAAPRAVSPAPPGSTSPPRQRQAIRALPARGGSAGARITARRARTPAGAPAMARAPPTHPACAAARPGLLGCVGAQARDCALCGNPPPALLGHCEHAARRAGKKIEGGPGAIASRFAGAGGCVVAGAERTGKSLRAAAWAPCFQLPTGFRVRASPPGHT